MCFKSCYKEFEDIEIVCPDEEQNGAAYIQVILTLKSNCAKCLKNQPCNVIKMREMRWEVGKKISRKEMDIPSFLWRHMADFFVHILLKQERLHLKSSGAFLVLLICFFMVINNEIKMSILVESTTIQKIKLFIVIGWFQTSSVQTF